MPKYYKESDGSTLVHLLRAPALPKEPLWPISLLMHQSPEKSIQQIHGWSPLTQMVSLIITAYNKLMGKRIKLIPKFPKANHKKCNERMIRKR